MKNEIMYSQDHIWVMMEDSVAVLGLSAYAQQKLGGLVFLNLPNVGEVFNEGDVFGDVESIKTVSDLVFPFQGEIIEINESILDNPENISEKLEDSWLVKANVRKFADNLMDGTSYKEYTEQL